MYRGRVICLVQILFFASLNVVKDSVRPPHPSSRLLTPFATNSCSIRRRVEGDEERPYYSVIHEMTWLCLWFASGGSYVALVADE
jgi:hypothetical protein